MEVAVSHYAVVSLPTEIGMRTFTDVTFEVRGEVHGSYGSRYLGALSRHDVERERLLFVRRRSDGRP